MLLLETFNYVGSLSYFYWAVLVYVAPCKATRNKRSEPVQLNYAAPQENNSKGVKRRRLFGEGRQRRTGGERKGKAVQAGGMAWAKAWEWDWVEMGPRRTKDGREEPQGLRWAISFSGEVGGLGTVQYKGTIISFAVQPLYIFCVCHEGPGLALPFPQLSRVRSDAQTHQNRASKEGERGPYSGEGEELATAGLSHQHRASRSFNISSRNSLILK